MTESALTSLFSLWNKLQEKLSSTATSSQAPVVPHLTKLNDMVYEVHSPPPGEQPELEILFFHGLQITQCRESYFRTWMSRDNSQLWLQTWLVELFPKARIFIISYDSSAKRTHESGRLDMHCTAENLVFSLIADEVRVGKAGCPVVLVGHCLGGLVLKELCLSAGWMVGRKSAERPGVQRINDFFSHLRGMFFYGTPHSGSLLGGRLNNFFKGPLLEEMETFRASIARRNEEFNDLKAQYNWRTYGIGEARETYVHHLKEFIFVVPEASTRPYMDSYYSIAADHYEICKPEGMNASGFIHLRDFLSKIQQDGILQAEEMADAISGREYVIDLEGRAAQVCSMLTQPDINTLFIVGLSGIGKTTLAQQVFHNIGHDFAITCFVSLDNIEASSNCREQVLRKVRDGLEGVHRGSSLPSVLHHLKGRKVLLVLDNVESKDQLLALRTKVWLEGSASKLIITTTNSRLGTPSNTFEVPYLSWRESQLLFRHYAFDDGDGPLDLRDLIQQVIQKCDDFPLSLKIMAGYVNKEDVHEKQLWLDLIDRLEKVEEVDGGHDYRLWAKLRLCYDALGFSEKEIFLDVATIFYGFPFSMVKCIWSGSRESSHIAVINLKRRFLVYVELDGSIRMHGQLRSLGHNIACPRHKSLDKWKRVYGPSFAKELISNHQGNVNTQALKLQNMVNESLTIKSTAFRNYAHLQYLILDGVKVSWGRVELPTSLAYLRWTDALFVVCPVDFTRLEKLVALELRDCKAMKLLPPGVGSASKLMWLELEGCLALNELPVGLSRCLEHLGLKRTGLKKLPKDLRRFKGLKNLQANETRLTRVPQGLLSLKMLSSLDLSDTGVAALPEAFGELRQLQELRLSNTMLDSLPDSIGQLRELRHLDLCNTMLTSLPNTIGQLQDLSLLDLDDTCVKGLPESVGDLAKLQSLGLNDTPLETLPDSICRLRLLEQLELMGTQISALPGAIGELDKLETLHVSSPNLRAWPAAIGMLPGLKTLKVELGPLCENHALSLEAAEEVEGQEEGSVSLSTGGGQSQMGIHCLLSQLPPLHAVLTLTLHGTGYAQSWLEPLFCALHQMPSLQDLKLEHFNLVEIIPPELGTLTNLKYLHLNRWEKLLELPESLSELGLLSVLVLHDIPRLGGLPDSFCALPSLSSLVIRKCMSLQKMPPSLSFLSSSEREFSASQDNGSTSSESLEPTLPCELQLESVETDSWRVVECFLDCCWKHNLTEIIYLVECKKMKMAQEKAVSIGYQEVLDIKVAMELFSEVSSYFGRQDEGLNQTFIIKCDRQHSDDPHDAECSVTVTDPSKAFDKEEESELSDYEDPEEEGSVPTVFRYVRALCSILLCSR